MPYKAISQEKASFEMHDYSGQFDLIEKILDRANVKVTMQRNLCTLENLVEAISVA